MKNDDFIFEAPSPGSWDRTRTGFALANEEAAHATLCLYFNIPIQEIRIDNPIDDADNTGGWVRTIPDVSSPERLEDHVRMTLAGPLATGREILWPPSSVDGPDERILARLTYLLGYDEARWNSAVSFVKEFLKFPTTQHTIKLIGSALLERGAISGDDLGHLVDDDLKGGRASNPSSL